MTTADAGAFDGVTGKPIPVFDGLDVDGDALIVKRIVEIPKD
nr:hypothetical protein [Candidatus Njordarchaeum guaymaensis]